MRARLAQLVESKLVYRTGEPPAATYRFKHSLIRDEAYHSLVRPVRRQYHRQIAEALETRFPNEVATRPELVAHHFLEGDDALKGVMYLLMAARRAVMASANVEATHHAQRALDVLGGWPASPQRSRGSR